MNRAWGIGLYAPSGFVRDPVLLDRAIAFLEAQGHRVVVDPGCRARAGRFAGTDDERLAAIARMAADPRVELAIAVRGGYGWSRLLDRLDFAALARSGKRWMGHSDFTAFQLAALAVAGLGTFAGPMAAGDFGAAQPSAFTQMHCWQMLAEGVDEIPLDLNGPDANVEGTLWGGNLALVAHLCGTRFLPRIAGGILVLEDVGEAAYRVERMLLQLDLAGVLGRQRAIVLGSFTEVPQGPGDADHDVGAVVAYLRSRLRIPVYTGLPFGHVADKLTLPIGGRARLAVRDEQATLTLEDCR